MGITYQALDILAREAEEHAWCGDIELAVSLYKSYVLNTPNDSETINLVSATFKTLSIPFDREIITLPKEYRDKFQKIYQNRSLIRAVMNAMASTNAKLAYEDFKLVSGWLDKTDHGIHLKIALSHNLYWEYARNYELVTKGKKFRIIREYSVDPEVFSRVKDAFQWMTDELIQFFLDSKENFLKEQEKDARLYNW